MSVAPVHADVPEQLRAPVLSLSSGNMESGGNIAIIFIGITGTEYTHTSWQADVHLGKKLFNVGDEKCYEIRASPQELSLNKINSDLLKLHTNAGLTWLNGTNTDVLCMVILGKARSEIVGDVIDSLIQGWNKEVAEKNVCVVTTGDGKSWVLNLCKWAIALKMCNRIKYCNTLDYTLAGFVDVRQKYKSNMKISINIDKIWIMLGIVVVIVAIWAFNYFEVTPVMILLSYLKTLFGY